MLGESLVGVHDLARVKPPFRYLAVEPVSLLFPLTTMKMIEKLVCYVVSILLRNLSVM